MRPATNPMPVYMRSVHCSGKGLTLLDCSYSRNITNNDHSNDIGVRCGNGEVYSVYLLFKKKDISYSLM